MAVICSHESKSLILQGKGAFIAKLVVSPASPSALVLWGGGPDRGRRVPGTTASLVGGRSPEPTCSFHDHRLRCRWNRDHRLPARSGQGSGGGRRSPGGYESSRAGFIGIAILKEKTNLGQLVALRSHWVERYFCPCLASTKSRALSRVGRAIPGRRDSQDRYNVGLYAAFSR